MSPDDWALPDRKPGSRHAPTGPTAAVRPRGHRPTRSRANPTPRREAPPVGRTDGQAGAEPGESALLKASYSEFVRERRGTVAASDYNSGQRPVNEPRCSRQEAGRDDQSSPSGPDCSERSRMDEGGAET